MLVQLEKWAKNERVTQSELQDACSEVENGLIDAYLGGGVIKKRVALKGRGKSGGARTLIAYKKGSRLLIMYAFKKNQLENISKKELVGLKEYS
ncbi:type II toxin-antitoxin system RelE/ParE family toxin [Piscirickettsia salmonis]|nr:type II toxin-antitoxin system RelE/ParE family toxin [Piscirickettsia salmonis]